MTAGPQRPRLVLCLAIVWLVWGSSYLATRIGVAHLPPLLFGGIRFLVAGLLLLAFAAWRGMRLRELPREWPHVLVLGLTGVACVNGLQTWAMQWVPSNLAALLVAGFARGEAAAWTWSSTGLFAMAWLTLFSACLAYTAYTWLATHASPAVVGTYGYVNPAIAALLGYLVLGERLAGLQGLGMAVILAGVVMINWPSGGSISITVRAT